MKRTVVVAAFLSFHFYKLAADKDVVARVKEIKDATADEDRIFPHIPMIPVPVVPRIEVEVKLVTTTTPEPTTSTSTPTPPLIPRVEEENLYNETNITSTHGSTTTEESTTPLVFTTPSPKPLNNSGTMNIRETSIYYEPLPIQIFTWFMVFALVVGSIIAIACGVIAGFRQRAPVTAKN